MARCIECRNRISYAANLKSGFLNLFSNFGRSKMRPLIACPVCQTQNSQTGFSACVNFVWIAFYIAVLFVLSKVFSFMPSFDNIIFLAVSFGGYLILDCIWWEKFIMLDRP